MPTMQIKHVPEETHAILRRRAAAAGQSLQQYMLDHLNRTARRETLSEQLAGIRAELEELPRAAPFDPDEFAAMMREERDRRP